MQFSLRSFLVLFAFASLFLLTGCESKGPKRYDHWGKVTFKGQPIPKGIMYFDPDLASNDGPQGSAVITNGEYDTRQVRDSGPGSGKYLLRITAADGIPGPEAPMGKPLFRQDVMIPVDLPAEAGELNIEIPPDTK
jgi:hypothetical protein